MIFEKKLLRKFQSLKWLHPHSISGAIVLVVGFLITVSSIIGNYFLVDSQILHVYLAACAVNSIYGAVILKGPPDVRLGFKFGIALQLSLVYICFRLRPAQLHFSWNLMTLEWLDKLLAINLLVLVVYSILGGFWILISSKDLFGNPTPRRTFVMLIFGGIGILFMSLYPMQLAFQGEEWLDCITERYPLQRQGFAGYVYVPTTWVLAIIFFGITLEARKILTNKQLNLYGVSSVVGILILTVMMQEYHIPYVSTQKLFIPCQVPEENSLASWANDALDFSAGAQKYWSRILGRSLVPPELRKTEL